MKWLLYPFSLVYGFIVFMRNKLFDYHFIKQHEFDIPIISIGNITIGGTGKTPHIEYLVKILNEQFNVATLSRGYRRKTRGFKLADKFSNVADIGDEPKQIKQKFPDIDVAVDEDRVRGIKTLLSDKVETDIRVILLDDAFQHRHVKPGYSILLIDYNRPITKDHLIPSGRLREQAYEKRRANMILITKSPRDLKPIERRIMVKELNLFPYQTLFFTCFNYKSFVHVYHKNILPIEEFIATKRAVLLLTGIAKTRNLIEFLEPVCSIEKHHEYPDHHYYTEKDIEKVIQDYENIEARNKIIITTEKDAMRLMELQHERLQEIPLYYIDIEIEFLNEDQETFNKMIMDYVKRNKKKKMITTPRG